MARQKVKSLLAGVSFVRDNRDNYQVFAFDEFVDFDLTEDDYDQCRFINIGDVITLENNKYIVTNLIFRLNSAGNTVSEPVDLYSDEQDSSNCTLLVFIKEYNG
jgi:hypothetical protein